MEYFSPVQELVYNDLKIWVKRDDLIDPYISGNKWRKLKYTIQNIKIQNKTHLVTFGGAYSNHLVASAAAAARFGISATGFVRGEEVTNEMLFICKLYGMNLIFVDRESYRDKKSLFETHFSNQPNAYFVDEGGSSEEAVQGCAEIIDELDLKFDNIFCAAGTGSTAAGLLRGINRNELKTQLHVIPVLKNGGFIGDEIKKFERPLNNLHVHTNFHFGGYAKTDNELLTFIKTFSAKTGILIDPVYTGKMFFAISKLMEEGQLDKNAKTLAIHTGGLFGLLGMKEKF